MPVLSPIRLAIHLLGPPQVLLNGEAVAGLRKAHKPLVLLAYLAVEADRPHQRAHLAALFWPDHSERQALQNLRQTLSRLRRALRDNDARPSHLLVDSQTVQFNRESDYWLDVDEFRHTMASTRKHPHRRLAVCPTCVNRLSYAETLYRGEFLAEIPGTDSALLDEWLFLTRERLAYQARIALRSLVEAALARGDLEHARHYALRLTDMDPWNEEAQRLLLEVLARSEGRNAALRHFHAYVHSLKTELGVEPEDATLALIERIQAGEWSPADGRASTERTHSLPTPPTSFIGREEEQQRLEAWLAARDQRLITVYGPGGVGKTRLVIEVAARQIPLWTDGVYFVPLAHTGPQESLAEILARALRLPPSPTRDDTARLLEYLRPRELLLILDSFEFLLQNGQKSARRDNLALLANILRWAPAVKLLITSRVRLGLQGEWALRLEGLPVPDRTSAQFNAREYHSLQLFLERARQVDPDFTLTPSTLPDAARLCRSVAGLPLAIELAAAWVHRLPVRQIADEVARNLDFLQVAQPDLPPRHHSLRATFEHSYALLSSEEQRVLRGLSVFHGGFTEEAAQHILETDQATLRVLRDASLVYATDDDRLHLHPLVHQYVVEKWARVPGEGARAQERHAIHFLHLVAALAPGLHGEHPQDALDTLSREIENIRAAWNWAVEHGRADLVEAALEGMPTFHETYGLLGEGAQLFHLAADHLASYVALAGYLRAREARLLTRQGRYPQAVTVAKEAIQACQQANHRVGEAHALYAAGEALWHLGKLEESHTYLTQARDLARQVGAHHVEMDALRSLAGVAWRQNDYAQAREYLEAALACKVGNPQMRAAILHNLGVIVIEQGDYSAARRFYERALSLRDRLNDPRGVGGTLGNLGNFYLYLGRYDEAIRYYRRALVMLEGTEAVWTRCLNLGNLGLAYYHLGLQDLAERYARYAIQVAQEVGDKPTEAIMWTNLGHALTAQNRWKEARQAYEHSWRLRQEVGQTTMAMESLAGLARVALAQGDTDEALKHVEAILAHLETKTLHGTIDPFLVYWTCYQVLLAVDDARARSILMRAYHELQERARRIEEEELRHSFLTNVEAHRNIVDAYERVASRL